MNHEICKNKPTIPLWDHNIDLSKPLYTWIQVKLELGPIVLWPIFYLYQIQPTKDMSKTRISR